MEEIGIDSLMMGSFIRFEIWINQDLLKYMTKYFQNRQVEQYSLYIHRLFESLQPTFFMTTKIGAFRRFFGHPNPISGLYLCERKA